MMTPGSCHYHRLWPISLKCVWVHSHVFSAIFTKGDNISAFLFAFPADIALQNLGLLLKKRIYSKRGKFFPLRVNTP